MLLVEAGPRLLPSFPESLSHHAEQALQSLGVDVRLKQAVTHCAASGVTLGDTSVDAATVVWAAGVTASPAASWLDVMGDRVGRVVVGADLHPPGMADRGLLATVGRKTAVIAFGSLRLKGWFAWWLWGAAHIYFLVSLRNRLIVMTQWLWSYVSAERGARLITGLHTALDPDRPAPRDGGGAHLPDNHRSA